MATTDKGKEAVASLFAGNGAVGSFNGTNARVCVGNSSTAFSAAQTDLLGSSTYRKLVDGAPVVTGNSINYTATFDLLEANFEWLELGLANSASGDYLATRRTITGFGTKTSAEAWTVVVTVVVN